MSLLGDWEGKQRATLREMQSLIGTLQFVAGVLPPTQIFTNRMLNNLREAPKRGTESLSWGFKRDLGFFLALSPHYNGIKMIDKQSIEYQDELELDSCLTGCGARTHASPHRPFRTFEHHCCSEGMEGTMGRPSGEGGMQQH